jgi:hypothetical protein
VTAASRSSAFFRVFFVGGVIAYRGLFNWIRPSMYIPTMLIGPAFQILFFAYLGRFSKVEDDAFFVVGNAIQASAMSAVFAGTMTIATSGSTRPLRRCSRPLPIGSPSSWDGRCR